MYSDLHETGKGLQTPCTTTLLNLVHSCLQCTWDEANKGLVLPFSAILFKVGLYCLQCPQLKPAMAWLSLSSTNSTLPMIFLDQTGKGRPFSSTALFSLMHCHLHGMQMKLVMAWLFFFQDNLVEWWKWLFMLYTKETQVKGLASPVPNRHVSFFLFLNCTCLLYTSDAADKVIV